MDPFSGRAPQGTPVIDGDAVTFVWYGDHAPQLIGDFTGWEGGTPLDLSQVALGQQDLALLGGAQLAAAFLRS